MCGISACFDLSKRSPRGDNCHAPEHEKRRARLTVQLDNSVQAQGFRGPDAKGIWISPDNSAGLGHVRLSTRDLSSAGHQPMHSSDGSDDLHIVVNGELYYDPDLRDELAKEYKFQSTSDSEMVIALYRRFGVDFITHLRGEFSLVIYDSKRRTVVAARDRFGVKPLHYGLFDGRLLIATQAKGVAELLENKRSLRWDPYCLAQAGGHYSNRSLFEGIRRFPPGHLLVVKQDEGEELEFRSYYRTTFAANKGGTDNRPAKDLTQQLREHCLEAVRLRLVLSDVPVGVLLSGGVDSSAVAGMAAQLSRKRLDENHGNAPPLPTCFTIAFPDEGDFDESAVAQRTAEHLGLPIEKVVVTEQTLADEFDEACWRCEALMFDLHHIAKKALSRHISNRGFRVVLNGDGSDELFGGYSFFVADRLLEDDSNRAASFQSVDTSQRENLMEEQANEAVWYGVKSSGHHHEQHEAAKTLALPPSYCNLAVGRYDDWLVREVRDLSGPFEGIIETFTQQDIEDMRTYHPLHRGMLAWRKTNLPNMIISAISDGPEMSHGVESRPPFLDHVVADLANTFPVDMLVHLEPGEATEKWILREAVKPYVTHEVYKRRKQAFAAPVKWTRDGPIHRKLSSLITRANVEHLGFADWEVCKDLVERAFDQKDQLIFRNAIWLAQIISIGLQFGMQKLRLDDVTSDHHERAAKQLDVGRSRNHLNGNSDGDSSDKSSGNLNDKSNEYGHGSANCHSTSSILQATTPGLKLRLV